MIAESMMLASGVGLAAWAVHDANAHKSGTALIDRIAVGVLGALGVMLAVAVPLSRLPVLTEIQATVVAQTSTSVSVHVVATKAPTRMMCQFLHSDAFVTQANGVQLEVPRTVAGDPYIGNTRPAGRHDFGVWTVTYPSEARPAAVTFLQNHQCGWWMQTTITRIGPVTLR